MLMVIFGAGASYDSFPDIPSVEPVPDSYIHSKRPPLAKHLFDRRFGDEAARNPEALSLFPKLRAAAASDPPNVEEVLETITASASQYKPTIRQLISMRYYIEDVIARSESDWISITSKVLTYASFLDALDRWRNDKRTTKIALVTFNYDRFLDMSCKSTLNLDITGMESYVKNTTCYQLFKPHGSKGWYRFVESASKGKVGILTAAEKVIWTNDYFTETDDGDINSGKPFVPAIAIPTLTKTDFEFPATHREQLELAMSETTSLLLIGWRGSEKHFLELWKRSTDPAKLRFIQIVNTDPGRAPIIYNQLVENAGVTCKNVEYSYEGFSKFVAKHMDEFFIRASN